MIIFTILVFRFILTFLTYAVGLPPSIWDYVRRTGSTAICFTFWSSLAILVSLFAHASLAYEPEVRRLARLAASLGILMTIFFGLRSVDLVYGGMVPVQATDVLVGTLLFTIWGAWGKCRARWAALHAVNIIAFTIVFANWNPKFASDGGQFIAVLSTSLHEQLLFFVYYTLGAAFRYAALEECRARLALPAESTRYKVLIWSHMFMYFSVYAAPLIVMAGGKDAIENVQLLVRLSILGQYCVTPLLSLHIAASSRAHRQEVVALLAEAQHKVEMTEAANTARNNFLRYVFHEVRVPFNTVWLGLEALEDEAPQGRVANMLEDIRTMKVAADGMLRILNDTLETEKIAVGKFTLRMQPTSLRDTLHAVLRTIQPVARSLGIELEMDVAPDIPTSVLADAPRIMQVLGNFASNAIKACKPDSNGRVRISITCSDSPHRTPQFLSPRASLARASATCDPNVISLSEKAHSATATGRSVPYRRSRMRTSQDSMAPRESSVLDRTRSSALEWLSWISQWLAAEPSDGHMTPVSSRKPPRSPSPLERSRKPSSTSQEDPGASLPTTPDISIVPPSAEDLATTTVGHLWFQFRVSDNGSGLSDEQLQSLWSPFMQIDTQRPTAGSSGLGLYICKAIVMSHGGHVFADSEVGKGSTFGAELPLQVLAAAPTPKARRDSHSKIAEIIASVPAAAGVVVAPVKVDWRAVFPDPLTFLLVDDVTTNRAMLKRAISRALPGSKFLEAENGQEAVAAMGVHNTTVDVICMDKEMPIMNGHAATEAIREMGYTGVILGVTANALAEDQAEFVRAGVNAIITKPVNVALLLESVQPFLPRGSRHVNASRDA